MAKSDEYREMQISSGQLAAVILSLLALCVVIFYLGIRVGMKRAAEASALKARTQTAVPAPAAAPPQITPFHEGTPTSREPSPPTAAPSAAPAAGRTAAPAKIEPAEPKPAVIPAEKKTEAIPAAKTPAPAKVESKTKPPAAVKTSPASGGTYYIQAGALDTRPAAESIAQRIESLGFRAIVLNPLPNDKKAVYRVRVGPYETRDAVDAALGKLAGALGKKTTDFFLVKG